MGLVSSICLDYYCYYYEASAHLQTLVAYLLLYVTVVE